ncbi:hypothetical protein [Paraburkholderia sp. WC7.3g]|uniref:hypothetical protein n=1 Tax=Paraburkholderia sp. WC7.3g TaxID=2991070 RepID=UPI003D19071C
MGYKTQQRQSVREGRPDDLVGQMSFSGLFADLLASDHAWYFAIATDLHTQGIPSLFSFFGFCIMT